MRRLPLIGVAVGLASAPLIGLGPMSLSGQVPLGSRASRGQTVTPAFEGWYANSDGTFTISFGYYNRNSKQVIQIPIGENNSIEPAEFDGGQPTRFEPERNWGVFGVLVPADFGDREVVWTLKDGGKEFPIPGSLREAWQIDALAGEAGTGNTPPVLKFEPDGPEAQGPLGTMFGPLTTSVGTPLELSVWASDDGRGGGSVVGASRNVTVALAWIEHQGPGEVTFASPTARVAPEGGEATTLATFSEPGDYIIRVRANDSPVASAGHAQCCWTNAYVKITVR